MRTGRIFGFIAFVSSFAASAPAFADEREACVGAADQAQDLRDKGQYRRAREQLLVCSRDVCPGAVKRDCAQWLSDLDNTAPTVVISAKKGSSDITAVKVTLDGGPLVDKLEGKPILIDPGEHTFRYETAGAPPKEEKVVITAGQKNRQLTVSFADGATTPPPPPPPPEEKSGGVPILTYVLGGVSIVGWGVGSFFWISGISDKNKLSDTCGVTHSCLQTDVDSARNKLVIGDIVGFGVGGGALVGAVVVYILRPKAEASIQTGWNTLSLKSVDVKPLPGGGGAAVLGGTF